MESKLEPVTFPAPITRVKLEENAVVKNEVEGTTTTGPSPPAPEVMPATVFGQLEALNLPPTLSVIAQSRTASQILPNLYLSDALTARWGGTLDRLGVTHIVSVLEQPMTYPRTTGHLEHLHIPVMDNVDADLLSYFEQTTAFIATALRVRLPARAVEADVESKDILPDVSQTSEGAEGSTSNTKELIVLVHCLAGMSRSATIVCAYLLATTPMNTTETIAFVKSKRSIIQPNYGFRKQLEQWERRWFVATGKGHGQKKKKISPGIANLMKGFT